MTIVKLSMKFFTWNILLYGMSTIASTGVSHITLKNNLAFPVTIEIHYSQPCIDLQTGDVEYTSTAPTKQYIIGAHHEQTFTFSPLDSRASEKNCKKKITAHIYNQTNKLLTSEAIQPDAVYAINQQDNAYHVKQIKTN